MSIIQTEIYDAFIEAGVSEPKARAAATVATIPTNDPNSEELVTKADLRTEITALEARIAELKVEMVNLEGRMNSKIAELKIKIIGHETEIVGLGGGMDSEMTKPGDRFIRQSKKLERMIIAAIVVATGVIIAAIGIATTVIIAFIN